MDTPQQSDLIPVRSVIRVHLDTGPRDYDATKLEIGPDGSITLMKFEKVGEKPDLRPGAKIGDKVEEWRTTLLAVVGPDARLRAETVSLEEEASKPLNGGLGWAPPPHGIGE